MVEIFGAPGPAQRNEIKKVEQMLAEVEQEPEEVRSRIATPEHS